MINSLSDPFFAPPSVSAGLENRCTNNDFEHISSENHDYWKSFNLETKSSKHKKYFFNISINIEKTEKALKLFHKEKALPQSFICPRNREHLIEILSEAIKQEYLYEHTNYQKLVSHFGNSNWLFLLYQDGKNRLSKYFKINSQRDIAFFMYQLICATEFTFKLTKDLNRDYRHNFLLPDYLFFKKETNKNSNLLLMNTYVLSLINPYIRTISFYNTKSFNNNLNFEAPERLGFIVKHKHIANQALPEFTKENAVWCLGIILYKLINGNYPFKSDNDIESLNKSVLNNSIIWDEDFSPHCRDLIDQMLNKDPEKRISLRDIIKQPYFIETLELTGNEVTYFSKYYDLDLNDLSYQIETVNNSSNNSSNKHNSESSNNIAALIKSNSNVGKDELDYINNNSTLMNMSNSNIKDDMVLPKKRLSISQMSYLTQKANLSKTNIPENKKTIVPINITGLNNNKLKYQQNLFSTRGKAHEAQVQSSQHSSQNTKNKTSSGSGKKREGLPKRNINDQRSLNQSSYNNNTTVNNINNSKYSDMLNNQIYKLKEENSSLVVLKEENLITISHLKEEIENQKQLVKELHDKNEKLITELEVTNKHKDSRDEQIGKLLKEKLELTSALRESENNYKLEKIKNIDLSEKNNANDIKRNDIYENYTKKIVKLESEIKYLNTRLTTFVKFDSTEDENISSKSIAILTEYLKEFKALLSSISEKSSSSNSQLFKQIKEYFSQENDKVCQKINELGTFFDNLFYNNNESIESHTMNMLNSREEDNSSNNKRTSIFNSITNPNTSDDSKTIASLKEKINNLNAEIDSLLIRKNENLIDEMKLKQLEERAAHFDSTIKMKNEEIKAAVFLNKELINKINRYKKVIDNLEAKLCDLKDFIYTHIDSEKYENFMNKFFNTSNLELVS